MANEKHKSSAGGNGQNEPAEAARRSLSWLNIGKNRSKRLALFRLKFMRKEVGQQLDVCEATG
jgi:hypothetical protein